MSDPLFLATLLVFRASLACETMPPITGMASSPLGSGILTWLWWLNLVGSSGQHHATIPKPSAGYPHAGVRNEANKCICVGTEKSARAHKLQIDQLNPGGRLMTRALPIDRKPDDRTASKISRRIDFDGCFKLVVSLFPPVGEVRKKKKRSAASRP